MTKDEELEKLRAFAQNVIDEYANGGATWEEIGQTAVEYGLLVYSEDGENYIATSLLTGEKNDKG